MTDLFIRGLRIDWEQIPADCYLHDIPSVRGIDQLNFAKNITFFVGENGSGKSTLLEAIAAAYGFNPEGGTINYHFSTYDDVSSLADGLTLIKGFDRPRLGYFFRAETFFNVATVGMVEYLGSDYHSNSHGEGFLPSLLHKLLPSPTPAWIPSPVTSLTFFPSSVPAQGHCISVLKTDFSSLRFSLKPKKLTNNITNKKARGFSPRFFVCYFL